MTEREAFDEWVRMNGGGLRSLERGSPMWHRLREAFLGGWGAHRESNVSGSDRG